MDNSNTYPPTREDFSDWIDDAEQVPATQAPFTREGGAVDDSARPDPDPAPAAVDAMPWEDEEDDGDAAYIPWNCRRKVDHFPAFVARGGIFKAGRPAAGLGSVEAKIQGLGGAMCLGQQLGMRDKPVWEIAVQVAKENSANMCAYAPVSLREFAARLGWTDRSGKALAWIWACIERLSQARVELELADGTACRGPLLDCKTEGGRSRFVRVNPGFAEAAFGREAQFRIDSARRSMLPTALAQWLHDFLSTHSKSYDMKLGYLRELSAFGGQARSFPQQLERSLEELRGVAPGLVEGFDIERRRRDSSRWVLRIRRGPETVCFEPVAATTCGRAGKWAAPKARRSDVAR